MAFWAAPGSTPTGLNPIRRPTVGRIRHDRPPVNQPPPNMTAPSGGASTSRSIGWSFLLNGSVYGEHVDARPVVNWPGLTGYLLKEATPQAQYRKGFRRVGGSIPLGELGGDRVALSNDLRDTLVRNGKIEPYRRTYAKRQKKVSTPQPAMQAVEPVSLELSRAA